MAKVLALAVVLAGLAPAARAQRLVSQAPAPASVAGAGATFSGGVWDSWGSYWDLRTWSQGWGGAGSIAPLPQLSAKPPQIHFQPKAPAILPAADPTARIARSVPEPVFRDRSQPRDSAVPSPNFRLRALQELEAPGANPAERVSGWMSGQSGGLAELSVAAVPRRPAAGLKSLFERLAHPSFLPKKAAEVSDEAAGDLAGQDFEYRIGRGPEIAADAPVPAHRFFPDFPKDEEPGKARAKNASRPMLTADAGVAPALDRPMVDAPRAIQPLGAALAPLTLVRRPRTASWAAAPSAGSAPLSRFYISLKAPTVEDPAAFLNRSVDDLQREAGFRMERALGYRPESGGPVLIVLGELPPDRLDGLRKVPQVTGVDPAPSLGVKDSLRDAPNSGPDGGFSTWLRSGPPSFFSALLLAFPWVGMLLRRLSGW